MMEVIAAVLMIFGLVILGGSTVGLLRLPDFYCRMHAAGKADTLSSIAMFTGLAIYNLATHGVSAATLLVAIKIMFICIFISIFSPTATHALTNAGLSAGIKPWTADDDDPEDAE